MKSELAEENIIDLAGRHAYQISMVPDSAKCNDILDVKLCSVLVKYGYQPSRHSHVRNKQFRLQLVLSLQLKARIL